jgi:hypothetical protein
MKRKKTEAQKLEQMANRESKNQGNENTIIKMKRRENGTGKERKGK